jgi:hypothetical protein
MTVEALQHGGTVLDEPAEPVRLGGRGADMQERIVGEERPRAAWDQPEYGDRRLAAI